MLDEDLAAACARGDGRAWSELVQRYDGNVRRVLRSTAPDEADDLRQDVWARLLANDRAALRRFRAGSLRLFIGQVARRVAIDHRRRARDVPRLDPDVVAGVAPGALELLRREARTRRLAATLDSIAAGSARTRDVLRLHFEEGWSVAEIAGAGVGTSARGVESVLRRARPKLVKLLAEDDP